MEVTETAELGEAFKDACLVTTLCGCKQKGTFELSHEDPLYPHLAINNINTSCYTEGCALDLKTQVVGVEKVKELLKREPTATQQAMCLFIWTMCLHASLVAEQ